MDDILVYEDLVEQFNSSLLTNLRGHSAGSACLDSWVPDENPVKSILNMVEAAEFSGQDSIRIRFAATTLDESQRAELLGLVADLGKAEIAADPKGGVLTVRDIGA